MSDDEVDSYDTTRLRARDESQRSASPGRSAGDARRSKTQTRADCPIGCAYAMQFGRDVETSRTPIRATSQAWLPSTSYDPACSARRCRSLRHSVRRDGFGVSGRSSSACRPMHSDSEDCGCCQSAGRGKGIWRWAGHRRWFALGDPRQPAATRFALISIRNPRLYAKFPWYLIPKRGDVPMITGHYVDGSGTFSSDANLTGMPGTAGVVTSTLVFSTPGCWEVTGAYNGSKLTFRIRVG